LLLVGAVLTQPLMAQSKKKLKEEIVRLKDEKNQLEVAYQDLSAKHDQAVIDKQQLANQNATLQQELQSLREQIAAKEKAYQLLEADKDELKSELAEIEQKEAAKDEAAEVDPNDTRRCAVLQGTLESGYSYTERFTRLNSYGWGIQVYAYYNLCQASEKAEEFKKYYKMYRTYIHVKEVNGRKMYAVVYGSLKDYDQAKIYCDNFKKIVKDPEAKGAFLIQHTSSEE